MMTTRFVPFRSGLTDVAVLQNRMNSIFHDFAGPGEAENLSAGNFLPALDVYEDQNQVVLKLEVPGIARQDLDIRVEGRVLTVKGERRFENAENEENFRRVERRFGSFVRSFKLPSSVDTESVSAVTEDGVLTLRLSKKVEAKPRQIEVQIAPAGRQVEAGAAA